MINLSVNEGLVTFEFTDNDRYLQDGTIEVPVNSLMLVTDESEMFTFRKAVNFDIFISGLYSEIGKTKAELETYFKENMVGSTGGGSTADTEALKGLIQRDLTSIDIPSGTTSIGKNAFFNCSGLTSVNIGSGLTSIGVSAFQNCYSLSSIDIPDSVTSIDSYAFDYCTSLSSCTIGSGVTSIGQYAFEFCSGLTSIDIPSGVTTINDYTFRNCTSLTSCTIGSGVTSINQSAFRNCIGLTSITCLATTPPTLANTNAFINTNNCPIYVPSASVNTYKSASVWSNYASRIQAIP